MDFVRTSSRSGPNKPALDLVSVRPAFALREIRCSPVDKKHPALQLPSPSSRPVHQSADVEGSTSSPKPSHLISLIQPYVRAGPTPERHTSLRAQQSTPYCIHSCTRQGQSAHNIIREAIIITFEQCQVEADP
ncbi:hypothetical protein TsFJ059_000435 [Trichoderma semiorbis]|uniref:Uncharacterized protein n=1 Tax=Trichoderma semiorbis TaxID=1491008 RepID=A0A9P8HUM2_9HYPO|nr:hypothetical protein TsFJ059_000435 [Trichoderma semiorbis]